MIRGTTRPFSWTAPLEAKRLSVAKAPLTSQKLLSRKINTYVALIRALRPNVKELPLTSVGKN